MAALTKEQIDAWNKRNQQAFQGILDVNQFIPVSGDVQSGLMAADDLRNQQYGSAALNAVGLLPFIPSLGGVTKNVVADSISNNPEKWISLTNSANDDISRSKFLTKYKDYNLYHEDLTDPTGAFGHIRAYDKDGNAAGQVFYGKRDEIKDNNFYEGSVEVNPKDRRKGLATEMYNRIENITGGKMIPAESNTDYAKAFWKNRKLKNK